MNYAVWQKLKGSPRGYITKPFYTYAGAEDFVLRYIDNHTPDIMEIVTVGITLVLGPLNADPTDSIDVQRYTIEPLHRAGPLK